MVGKAVLLVVIVMMIVATPWVKDGWAEDEACLPMLDPASLTLSIGGIDQPRSACGTTLWSVGAQAQTLEDQSVVTTLSLDARFLHASGFEFGVAARGRYRLTSKSEPGEGKASVGPLRVHAARPQRRQWWGHAAILTHILSVELPLTNSDSRKFSVVASPAILVTWLPSPSFAIHGRLAGILHSTRAGGAPDSDAAGLVSADAGWAVHSRWSLLMGGQVQGGLELDHVVARIGTRVGIGSGAIEVSGATALAGTQSTRFTLWLGYRRERAPPAASANKPSRLQDWAR